jgi:uncharacterized protein YbcC (UPF0753/DUF2309 family)
MSITHHLEKIKDLIPHYWPIGTFIHHNPLKGFEHLHFKEGLREAKRIFGGNVYMEPDYYIKLFNDGKIDEQILGENIAYLLREEGLQEHFDLAKKFLIEVSPKWNSIKNILLQDEKSINMELFHFTKEHSLFHDHHAWLKSITAKMTLYEINDALFDTDETDQVEKNIIEFVSRFTDEDQTTMQMPDRELGMFAAFKRYERIDFDGESDLFVEHALKKLQVDDIESYLLTHLLKLHGWAGFLKFRSEDKEYLAQRQYPSKLMDYIAVRCYYEIASLNHNKINNYKTLDHHIDHKTSELILKLLRYNENLPGEYIDALEEKQDYDTILENYIIDKLNFDTLRIQYLNKLLENQNIPLIELKEIISLLKKEEGYIWLKSLEDSYIAEYVGKITAAKEQTDAQVSASATFCLDVRSEVIRRSIEQSGPYQTYGAGGFLGIPIAFVEFDKAHELFLAPAIVKPQNVIFELPKGSADVYNSQKGINKTTKKVLSDLKNNPYTPYIMVEAIGWIFGINLFGKTFLPQKTHTLFSTMKPKKPETTYTIDKLSEEEIEYYVQKLHNKIIDGVTLSARHEHLSEEQIDAIRNHLLFETALEIDIGTELLEKLKKTYKITPEDYHYQKRKLAMVGFTLEEKVTYLHNYLTLIGQVNDFPEFVTVIGHGSVSDNNPFESALDCGACGGNISLPNTRTLCMIANSEEVREALRSQKGITIPRESKFIPGLHNTTTDEIEFYDTEILSAYEMIRFKKVMEDFNAASKSSRDERAKKLPNTKTDNDIFIKALDWSEPRPEWGLAGNMGVFAGPRDTIKELNLNNRFFMHSYDHRIDNDNADILTKIFNGPLVVGEWINMEHYFSTVDNHTYGAGSKVYHNVVSKIGVFTGNYSDLKIGLPTQSVELEGEAYHEPIRLLTFMEAPLSTVGEAVENSIAKSFILNEWIRPIIIDTEAKKVYIYEYGDFKVIKEL